MFAEAVAEAHQARDFSGGSSHAMAFGSYALARSGKQAEASGVLEELLKSSTERYIPPYHLALAYNGLGERDKARACLERAFEERSPKIVFLKTEPKWDSLRDDSRFKDIMLRIGF